MKFHKCEHCDKKVFWKFFMGKLQLYEIKKSIFNALVEVLHSCNISEEEL